MTVVDAGLVVHVTAVRVKASAVCERRRCASRSEEKRQKKDFHQHLLFERKKRYLLLGRIVKSQTR
jgi:hypothetical protein